MTLNFHRCPEIKNTSDILTAKGKPLQCANHFMKQVKGCRKNSDSEHRYYLSGRLICIKMIILNCELRWEGGKKRSLQVKDAFHRALGKRTTLRSRPSSSPTRCSSTRTTSSSWSKSCSNLAAKQKTCLDRNDPCLNGDILTFVHSLTKSI